VSVPVLLRSASSSGKAHSESVQLATGDQGADLDTAHSPVSGLASVGLSVTRYGLATTFLWVGALKFRDYEVENAEPLVTASPLTSRLREQLGAQNFARLVGVTQITLGSLIAAKPFVPRASAVGSFGAAGMMVSTLSFLVTTPEAWQEGQGVPQLSMLGEALLKDSVLLGASLLTAAESLRAAHARARS
jgi:reactive chlorine resistance protein C